MKRFFSSSFLLACTLSLVAGCSSTASKVTVDHYEGLSATKIMAQAKKHLLKGSYRTAAEDLDGMISHHPYGKTTEKARLWSIYANFKAGEDLTAIANAQEYIHLYPQSQYNDYVYYLMGMIYYHQGGSWLQRVVVTDPARRDLSNIKQAMQSFQVLVRMFPRSSYVKPSREMMFKIGDIFAQHEWEVAQYYYKLKQYPAARARLQELMEKYPGSKLTKKAKALLKQLPKS